MNTHVDQAIVELDRVPQDSIRPPSATPPIISIVGKSGAGKTTQEGDALGLCGVIIDRVEGLR